jgi:multidrug efflux system membrane fusion protein
LENDEMEPALQFYRGWITRRLIRWSIGTAVTVTIGIGTYGLVGAPGIDTARSAAPSPPPARPVPVTVGEVSVEDFPFYRLGIGTVQAYNTVTVKVRVDGQIVKVNFHEGQDVKEGDPLVEIDPRPYKAVYDQAVAKLETDQANLNNAQLDYNRDAAIVNSNLAVSRQQFDHDKAAVAADRGTVDNDKAAIEAAQVNLDYTDIRAPLAGRTGVRLIDQGNIVHASDANGLVVITQLKPIAVIFTLPQQYLPAVTDALQRGSVTVLAYDQDNRSKLGEGRLELIDNQVDQGTGSARLKAIFPNDDERLWPGTFVNAWLRLESRRGPVVPTPAVQAGPNGDFAFLIRPDSTVEARPVHVVATWEGKALIGSGLAAGDHVVIDGQYKLRPGTQVIAAAPGTSAAAQPQTATR